MHTTLRRAARPTVLGLAGALAVLLAAPAQAAQPSNWGATDAGPGRARALTFSALKAASIGTYTEAWRASLAPTTVTDCAGGQGAAAGDDTGLGYGAGSTFAVSGGVVLTPEKALDATSLTDRWDIPRVDGYRSTLLAASADAGVFSVGGDVLRLVQGRRLSDGALLWERAGTPTSAAFSSDDAWLLLQTGGLLEIAFPHSGVNNFNLKGVQLRSASATDLVVLRGSGLERYSWTGSLAASGPQDGARFTAIAGKLLYDSRGPFSPGLTGLSVLNASTLAPVATVATALRVDKVIPAGNRLAVTTLTAAGQRDGGVVVLASPI